VPLPWSGTMAPFGFGPAGTPWLPQPPNWDALTAQAQDTDPLSTLAFYRSALAARRSEPALGDGSLRWLTTPPGMLAFARGDGFACVTNFTDSTADLPPSLRGAPVLLTSSPSSAGTVPPATTTWFSLVNG
ncbi:MAG: DUF3459 domain-containing protein, partial [Actinomycetota bacterium]|nr:DUF3459 domain-containing protein [Actinomycetota bacterium]